MRTLDRRVICGICFGGIRIRYIVSETKTVAAYFEEMGKVLDKNGWSGDELKIYRKD